MKNRKPLIALLALGFIVAIGGSFAYFFYTERFPNKFKLGTENVSYIETFDSPGHWTPCTETPKTIVVRNDSTGSIDARVKITRKEWEDGTVYDSITGAASTIKLENAARFDASGNLIPADDTTTAVDHTKDVTHVNFSNPRDWALDSDGWYYYQGHIEPGQTSNSFIESVVFECDAPSEYANTTFHLEITVQTIGSDGRSENPDWH
jgi:alternate signal-mediated exported protein